MTPLSPSAIEKALAELPGWRYADEALKKTYTFSNFQAAVSFIVRMAFKAEAMNHHPEIFNVYNRVELTLHTHDAGNAVTHADVQLARAIEEFVWV